MDNNDSSASKKRKKKQSETAIPDITTENETIPTTTDIATTSDSIATPPIRRILEPFWNQYTRELSQKLWLPTTSNCNEYDLSLLKKMDPVSRQYILDSMDDQSKKLMLNSWFSVKIQTPKVPLSDSQLTLWQSVHDSLHDATPEIPEKPKKKRKKRKNANLDKPDAGKSIRIRIYPTTAQKQILRDWFGASRWIYNQCIQYMNEKRSHEATKNYYPKVQDLRNDIVNDANFITQNQWCGEYNSELRASAMDTFRHNLSTNVAKAKIQKKPFKLSFKTRKGPDSIALRSKFWNKAKDFFSPIFSVSKMRTSEPLPKKIYYDGRLVKTALGKYFFVFPQPLEQVYLNEDEDTAKQAIFIDPGVKNFITGFDPNLIMWGKRDMAHIARILFYSRKLQSRIDKCKDKRKKKRMRKAFLRMNDRIYNLTDDLHKKLVLWLVTHYDEIYISRLNFHNFKKLNKREKKTFVMACYRHCGFLKRLKDKTREFSRTKMFEVFEDYTSKTCTNCGYIDNNLSNKDLYDCSRCSVKVERDITGARNIMLKHLTWKLSPSN